MAFELPQLPYAPDALAPWTSAETFSYHHGKHHAAYVKKLNDAIVGTAHETASLEDIIAASRGKEPSVFNNAAQHWNHSFFWECLAAAEGAPDGALKDAIIRDFGSVEAFKEQFGQKALTLFGSGWAWLTQDADGKLAIGQYKDAETPVGTDASPLLTLDVWEHAYYVDHRNDRAGFIAGFWAHVDWAKVAARLR
jgi:superoxide dismutase, Fe-Mn family